MYYKIECNELYKDIEDSVSAATGEVPKGLGRYPTGERAVKKIYDRQYDMSYPRKQI